MLFAYRVTNSAHGTVAKMTQNFTHWTVIFCNFHEFFTAGPLALTSSPFLYEDFLTVAACASCCIIKIYFTQLVLLPTLYSLNFGLVRSSYKLKIVASAETLSLCKIKNAAWTVTTISFRRIVKNWKYKSSDRWQSYNAPNPD